MISKLLDNEQAQEIKQMLLDVIDYSKVTISDTGVLCAVTRKKIHDAEIQTIDECLKEISPKDYSYTIFIERNKLFINVYRY